MQTCLPILPFKHGSVDAGADNRETRFYRRQQMAGGPFGPHGSQTEGELIAQQSPYNCVAYMKSSQHEPCSPEVIVTANRFHPVSDYTLFIIEIECQHIYEPVCLLISRSSSRRTLLPLRPKATTKHVELSSNPSPTATTTSSTVACVRGHRQRQKSIGCEPSTAPPPCNHPVNHSGALEFCCDAVAPGAPLC